MKKLNVALFSLFLMGNALGAPSSLAPFSKLYKGATNKLHAMHTSLVMDGMMSRAYQKLPDFLKGDNPLDSTARITFVASALYMGIKPLMHSDNNAKRLMLGLIGWVFSAIGVDNLTVQGNNFADLAKKEHRELKQHVRQTLDQFASQSIPTNETTS